MKKSIGIIGSSGRMGQLISQAIQQEGLYDLGIGFHQNSDNDIHKVFSNNDFIIDFSSHKLIPDIINAATKNPKPMAICTTGWDFEQYRSDIEKIALTSPVIIASNTSLGANLQRYLSAILAKALDDNYDIDIIEKHHRNKIDIPSGTATSLLQEIQQAKKSEFSSDYKSFHLTHGPRPKNFIGMHVERAGNIFGEHEITFINESESISIKHTAFNRELFANGVLKIIKWLDQPIRKPGIYSMNDVLNLR